MASSVLQTSLLAFDGLHQTNKVRQTAHPLRCHLHHAIVAANSDATVNCAPAADAAGEKVVRSASSRSSSPHLDGGFAGANSVSRREAVVAGLTLFAGLGGTNLLFSPAIEATEAKLTGLPIEEVKKIIEADIIERQYPVTGNLTESIYKENCRFQDPTIDIEGVEKYTTALQFLFEPSTSKHEILKIGVTGPRTVQVDWRLRGYMKLPWRPYIPPYEGTTTYTTDESGLVASHSETWKISPFTAFIQALTPSFLSRDAPR